MHPKKKRCHQTFFFCFQFVFGSIFAFLQFGCECYFVCKSFVLSGAHNWYRQCFRRYLVKPKKKKKKVVFEAVWLKWGGWYLKNLIFRRIKPCQMRKMSFSENHFLWKQHVEKKFSCRSFKYTFVRSFCHWSELIWTIITKSGAKWKSAILTSNKLDYQPTWIRQWINHRWITVNHR